MLFRSRSNHSPSTSASLKGALVVLVWREVAGQSRFRHDQTGNQDLGGTLSKSGVGLEDRRGSGQYVSPWMMTVWSSLRSRVMLDVPCSPSVRGSVRPPMPIGRLRSNSHFGEPKWVRTVPVVCRPAGTMLVRSQPELLPIWQPPEPQHTRSLRRLGPSEPQDPLHFLRRSPRYAPQLCHLTGHDIRIDHAIGTTLPATPAGRVAI